MEFSDYLELIGVGLISVGIPLVFWVVSLILVRLRYRHNMGRAERFLITGISIKIVINVLNIAINHLSAWLVQTGMDIDTMQMVTHWSQYFSQLIGYIGIVIILYAFWVKFTVEKEKKTVITERN